MRRIATGLLFSLIVALPSCCVYNNVRHPTQKMTLAQHLEKKTVSINHWVGVVGRDDDGDPIMGEVNPEQDKNAVLQTYCTGVWVNNDTFITANHCVEIHKPPLYKFLERLGISRPVDLPAWSPVGQKLQYSAHGDIQDQTLRKIRTTRECTVIAVDEENDLAIVRADTDIMNWLPEHEVATVASSVQVGDNVHVMGHPNGLLWTYVRGSVAQIRNNFPSPAADEHKINVLHVSAPVWFGNSGGGAFNDNGELIGISSFIRVRMPDTAFFVKYDNIEHFLTHNQIKHSAHQ